jgi:predicted alpha-1,6-mannanase (GH76 family)
VVFIEGAAPFQTAAYNAGRNAAVTKHRTEPPSKLKGQFRYWWLAGFNDVELERKYKQEKSK